MKINFLPNKSFYISWNRIRKIAEISRLSSYSRTWVKSSENLCIRNANRHQEPHMSIFPQLSENGVICHSHRKNISQSLTAFNYLFTQFHFNSPHKNSTRFMNDARNIKSLIRTPFTVPFQHSEKKLLNISGKMFPKLHKINLQTPNNFENVKINERSSRNFSDQLCDQQNLEINYKF